MAGSVWGPCIYQIVGVHGAEPAGLVVACAGAETNLTASWAIGTVWRRAGDDVVAGGDVTKEASAGGRSGSVRAVALRKTRTLRLKQVVEGWVYVALAVGVGCLVDNRHDAGEGWSTCGSSANRIQIRVAVPESVGTGVRVGRYHRRRAHQVSIMER